MPTTTLPSSPATHPFIIPPALVPPGLDGIQDFTVSINAGPDILFIDEPDLFIDALNGDDDIVIRAPAPNDADWDVNVRVAGGPPSIGEPNEGDRLVLETPGVDSVVFNPTGPDTGSIVDRRGRRPGLHEQPAPIRSSHSGRSYSSATIR